MGWLVPRRSRSFAGSHGRRFPRRGGGPSRVPARAVLLLLVMVAALAPRAFAQTTPSPGARWTPGGVWTHDVTTTSLIGKLMLQQSVTITGGSRVWNNAAIDACPWTRVVPPLPSTSCESLKGYGAIPGQPFRNNPLTVANFAPTQAMIDNGGVVIRLRWQGFNSPAGGNVGMTEWVPLEPPATNATLVLTPASISENAGVSTVTATLDRTTSAATTITVSAAAVAPAVSGDFALSSTRTLTIAAGATTSTGTVTITASGNNLDAPDKSVTVSGTATGEVGNPSDVTLTIADDDATPTLSIDAPSMTEGDSGTATLTFTVSLSAASGRQVTVAYADAGTGTAMSGTDYTAITGGTLTFAAGTTTQTIDVSVTGDTADEADETVVVTLSSAANATIGTATGTGTITDDDATPTLSIDAPSMTEGDSGTATLTFTVSLSAASGRQVTVAYADAGTGTAMSGTDYTAITGGTLTFAAGTTTQTIDVSVTGDTADEADETVVVTLSNAANATIGTATGTGTITDDDATPTLSIDAPSMTEGDSGTATLTFTVSLSAASGRQVTVAYADAGTGTATSGTDYTAITGGTLTFAAETTSRSFDVSVTGDTLPESNETVVVTLSGETNATLATATGTGTITNDDGPALSVNSPNVNEGDSGSANLTFTVTLSAASGQQVTVDWAEGTGGTATSGTDYTAITGGTLTFAAGTTTQTIDVSVTGDTADEADETVVVTLSNAANATIGTATGTGTITDDDEAPTVSIDSPSVMEGDSGSADLTFTVTLSAASGQQVTVGYADAATGTATSGTDYTAITGGTLTFAAGTTSQTIAVTVAGDVLDEADETIVVTLSAPVNATLAAASGTGTITDDDGAPTVSIDSPSVMEGDSGSADLTFTVTLSAASGQQVTVGYSDAGTGTATSGTDYTAIPAGTLTFTAGTTSQTIAVTVAGDVLDEADETIVVTLSAPVNATLAAASGTGTIADDDDAALRVETGGPGTTTRTVNGHTVTVVVGDGVPAGVVVLLPVALDRDVTLRFAPPAPGVPFESARFGLGEDPDRRTVVDVAAQPVPSGGVELCLPVAASLRTEAGERELRLLHYGASGWAAVARSRGDAGLVCASGVTALSPFAVGYEDSRPTFGEAAVAPQRYVQDLEIAPLALPVATGGNLPLTYALTGPGPASGLALPEGLAWSESAVLPPTLPTRPGTLTGTPTVPEQAATWTLTATDADGDTATRTFTIEILDRLRERLKGINEAILPDLSRAMTASTMDAVSGRIGQALSGDGAGAHGAMASADVLTGFAGLLQANEQVLEDGTWSWKQGLAGRRFALALSGDGPATGAGARVTAWGAGDYRSLSDGEGSAVDWDGHLFGAHLGMDARFGAGGLAGLALSVSKGRFDYTDTSAEALGTVKGEYESRMTSAHPYVGWAWPAGTHAWASLGYGRGDVTLTDGEAGRHTSDSTLRSAAAGGSVRVLSGEGPGVFGPVTVDLKGEAWTTRLAVEDNGERIAGLAVRTHRLRVAAEGARAFALGGGAAFTPSVELGMRFDGGDGETGAGVELGGGLDYAHPALGLSADVAGRVLLAHEGATEDWSVGGAVRLEPASGLGPSLRLAPSYGDTGSGLSRLWEGAGAGSGAGATGASPTTRLDTEMGYGLAAFAGVLTPYGGLGLSEGGARGYRLGARFLHGPAFELDLEGERRESRTERAGHGLMLRGRMRW